MKRYFIYFLLALAFALPTRVVSRPDGAPTCIDNRSAPGEPHRSNGFDESSIDAGGLEVSIGGELVYPDTPIQVETGVSYMVVISTTTFFRGVMTRLGGGDNQVDTSTVFTLVEGEVDLKLNENCDLDVGGLTHTNRADKVAVSFLMEFTEASDNMAWDVNIVETLSPSVFYYSQYTINAVAPGEGGPEEVEPDLFDSLAQVDGGSTLASLVTAAGLESTLKNEDETSLYTVLAPVQAAFDALPSDVVVYLTNNTDILSFVLQGHVLTGTFTSDTVPSLNGQQVNFLNGVSRLVSVTDSGIFIGTAQVLDVDVFASNGVIHSIDRILGVPTVLEFLEDEGLSALALAISSAGISLETAVDITLFAPTTTALLGLAGDFPELGAAILSSPDWILHLQALLNVHIYPGTVFSSDLVSGQNLTMFGGADIKVDVSDTITLAPAGGSQGIASIVRADIVTTQGAIHVLDQVLFPPFLTQSIVDVVQANIPTLASLVVTAGLDEILASMFGITVFAPNEEAFDMLDSDTLDFLTSDEGLETLVRTLSYHVVPQVLPSSSFTDPLDVETITGDGIFVSLSFGDVLVNDAVVVSADLLAYNGIIHTIDIVLEPPPLPDTTESPTAAPLSPDDTPTSTPVAPAPNQTESIYKVALDSEWILASLIQAAGVEDALSDPDASLTLLAPVDDAFESLPPRTVLYLTDNPEVLASLLLGHVLGVEATAAVVQSLNGTSVTFLNGMEYPVNVNDEGIFIGSAKVLEADIGASNGVIHLIDSVLGIPTFGDLLSQGGQVFLAILSLLEASGIPLGTIDDMTIFVPTTDALSGLATVYPFLSTDLLANPEWQLHIEDLIRAHVVSSVLFSEDFEDGGELSALNGDTLSASFSDGSVVVGPSSGPDRVATVLRPDIITTRAVVHVVDGVVIPTFLTRDVITLVSDNTLTFLSLILSAGFDQTIEDASGITVFAPSEAAFTALDPELLPFLTSDEGQDTLLDVLAYHVVGNVVPSTSVIDGSEISTEMGQNLSFKVSEGGTILVNGISTVTTPDQLASNGIVHIVDTVLLPSAATNTTAPTTMDLNTTAPSVGPNITVAPTIVAPNTTFPTMSPTLIPVNGTNTSAPTTPPVFNTTTPTTSPSLQPANGTNTSEPTTPPTLKPVNGTNTSAPTASPTLVPITATPTVFANVTTSPTISSNITTIAPSISPIPPVATPPTGEPTRTPSATEFPTSDPASARLSVVEVIAQTFSLQQLDAYITASGIVDEFTGPGPFTFMAPWDGAFLKIDPTWAERLQNETWNAHLRNLLHYHVLDGDLPIYELPLSATLTMQNGEDVTITRLPDTIRVYVNGVLAIAPYDATNGFAYMLDEVLLPSWFRHSLLDVVNAASSLSTFASLVVIAELEQVLSDSEGFLTVLPPDNAAFANLGEGAIDFLLSDTGLPVLQETLLYHIVELKEGPYPSRLFDSSPLETLASSETVSISPGDPSTVQGRMNAALVVVPDQVAINGVLHMIDTVLLLDSLSELRGRMV